MHEYAISSLIGEIALMIISPLPTSLRIRVNARMLSLFGVIADYYTNHYSKL
jgi:hypothetical protein